MNSKLIPGQKAPIFSTKDVFGNKIKLTSYRDKNVLVVFLRYAGCPWCNLAIHRLSIEYPLLKERNCEVVAFVQSSKVNILTNIYGRHSTKPMFPIIADPERKFYKKYDVKPSLKATSRVIVDIPYWLHSVKKHGFWQKKIDGSLFMAPGTFLINKDGDIASVRYSTSLFDHQTFTDIYEQLFLES